MSKTFSIEEVREHKSSSDCWLVYKNKVYDVTKFLEQHPGGEEVLLDVAGKDATNDFDDVGHSDEAVRMMEEYLIGQLDGASVSASKSTPSKSSGSERTPAQPASPFTWILPLGVIALALLSYFVLGKKE